MKSLPIVAIIMKKSQVRDFLYPDWRKLSIFLVLFVIFLSAGLAKTELMLAPKLMETGGYKLFFKSLNNDCINYNETSCERIIQAYSGFNQAVGQIDNSTDIFIEILGINNIISVLSPFSFLYGGYAPSIFSVAFYGGIELYIFNFIYWYLLSCLIVFIIDRIKK